MGFWANVGRKATSVVDTITGEAKAKRAEEEGDKYLKQMQNVKNKSVSELQQEGRGAAGQAAVGKAAEAKKASKAATMQTGGNRLQAATNAAASAGQAATEGFDASSQAYTQMAQSQDVAQKNAERQALGDKAEAAYKKASNIRDQNAQNLQTAGTIAGGILSYKGKDTTSDETTKKVKHTYIPADQRRK